MTLHSRRAADIAGVVTSLALVVLVAIAVAGSRIELPLIIISSAIVAALILNRLFPTSRLMWIAFINLIAVYASVFALFVDEVFRNIDWPLLAVGFVIPIAAFLAGCWSRRHKIRAVVTSPPDIGRQDLSRAVLWLIPVLAVGAASLSLSRFATSPGQIEAGFMVAMTAIGVIVIWVSRDVAVFLVDTGLLFEEFFQRLTRLIVPTFAFLTFYSLLIVVFAAVFRITSQHSTRPQFRIGQEERALSFPEALHFSAATLSTVGYGDIVPISTLARTLAATEVVLGVLLLLFGVSEIIEYAKERRNRHHDRR